MAQFLDQNDFDVDWRFHLLERSVCLSHTCALADLAYCYDQGLGTSIDKKRAFELYERAAREESHAVAMFNLAVFYECGLGVTKDLPLSRHWFQEARIRGVE